MHREFRFAQCLFGFEDLLFDVAFFGLVSSFEVFGDARFGDGNIAFGGDLVCHRIFVDDFLLQDLVLDLRLIEFDQFVTGFDHRSGFDHPQNGATAFDQAFDFFVIGAFDGTVFRDHHSQIPTGYFVGQMLDLGVAGHEARSDGP